MTSPVQSNLSSYMSAIASPRDTIRRLFGIHPKTRRSLSEEAESGDEFSVSSWVKDGADPNEHDSYGYTPLLNGILKYHSIIIFLINDWLLASANGRLKAVQNLVKSGADINMRGPYGYITL